MFQIRVVNHNTKPWNRWECSCGARGPYLTDRSLVVKNADLHADRAHANESCEVTS